MVSLCNKFWSGSPHSPPALAVVEEVAGFDVSVNDVTRVDVSQSLEQGVHVQSDLLHRHVTQIVLKTHTHTHRTTS